MGSPLPQWHQHSDPWILWVTGYRWRSPRGKEKVCSSTPGRLPPVAMGVLGSAPIRVGAESRRPVLGCPAQEEIQDSAADTTALSALSQARSSPPLTQFHPLSTSPHPEQSCHQSVVLEYRPPFYSVLTGAVPVLALYGTFASFSVSNKPVSLAIRASR